MSDGSFINVSSVYGSETREPLVQVQWGEQSGVLSLDAARQLGRDLIEAASASETDAFLMDFFEKRLGVKDINQRAGVLSGHFRHVLQVAKNHMDAVGADKLDLAAAQAALKGAR